MAKKRKRPQPTKTGPGANRKRARTDDPGNGFIPIEHPTLCIYYSQISTLRTYLLSSLPASSRSRRRKIASIGRHQRNVVENAGDDDPLKGAEPPCLAACPNRRWLNSEKCLATLLDKTLVCTVEDDSRVVDGSREKDFASFSQQANLTARCSFEEETSPISEIVDFAVWLLFHRIYHNVYRPPHLLCHGYQRAHAPGKINQDHGAMASIPGVVSHYPNSHVSTLKNTVWADVLGLLGKEGERIMLDLILKFGIFVAVASGRENYYQLCGTPLTELQARSAIKILPKPQEPKMSANIQALLKPAPNPQKPKTSANIQALLKPALHPQKAPKSSATIVFVRNRMFYARAALNAKGKVRFGLRHIHVLNRFQDSKNPAHTAHIMKYIFPRQFGLHNAFTSTLDSRETVQPFKDYTLREQEIARKYRQASLNKGSGSKPSALVNQHLPKRLRGAVSLVKRLQILHFRCSYKELLEHYCPLNGSNRRQCVITGSVQDEIGSQEATDQDVQSRSYAITPSDVNRPTDLNQKTSTVTFATPTSDVSAFCRATLSKILPDGFWGELEEGAGNKGTVMRNIDRFVRLRRFENLSLHLVSQGLKLGKIPWLIPPKVRPASKIANSDLQKRKEIFLEFIYYVFDSLLIPLIRSNFHVTESNVHRNRLFFFRHDVWRRLTEPSISTLKLNMFEEVKTTMARKLLDARVLGFSQIRLLPKISGFRPIVNLRRRVTKWQNGKVVLGRSINSVMAPVFNMLDYEKKKQSSRVGSALFSVGEIYPKLKAFRDQLQLGGSSQKPFYFVKADVKSCFDTIPQRRVVRLMENIASEDEYRIARYAEIKSSKTHCYSTEMEKTPIAARKFIATARATTDFETFDQFVDTLLARGKKSTVFVDNVVQTALRKDALLDLLEDHVERNIVKIGKKFFRQKAGIPQGSVLSSLLCSYFYAELENEHLGFLSDDESLLLRLIDDFLLITTNHTHAKRFLQVMHGGFEEYGVQVNPTKSLANFEVTVNDSRVPQLRGDTAFPYCGSMIDTKTLEITKDRDRRMNTVLLDSLTVEPSKTPGKTFHHKALNAFKIQTHKMFLDTTFNSLNTVLSTIYQNFVESAMKYYRYAKCMAAGGMHPHASLLIGTIQDLMQLAFVLIKAKPKKPTAHTYSCAVSKRQVQWLAAKAFSSVLSRKQSQYGQVLAWLDHAIQTATPGDGKELLKLGRIVKDGEAVFRGYKY